MQNLIDAYLGSVDELISQALSNGLDVSEGSLTGTSAQQPDGLWKRNFLIRLSLEKSIPRIGKNERKRTWFTLLRGETSTACLLTVPARPIRVESSRGPELMIAVTRICRGFSPVSRCMISKACFTILTDINFLPLLRPCIIREFVSRSTIGHCALRKRLAAYLPAEWGRYLAFFSFTAM
jgi:hypothetical protein